MNIAALDLNLLRVLDALLREGSTVRAGARLGLSQPAVSAALGRLRHALDDELFLRRGQGLVATDYARGLELPLREALDNLESLLAGSRRFDPARATDIFRLGGTDFFAEMLMPDLAARVSQQAPGMVVQMLDLLPDDYIGTLDRYETDILLLPQLEFPDWVDSRPVFRSTFVMIARAGHPALTGISPGEPVPIDLFCQLGHVLMSPEGRRTSFGDAALARIGRTRRVAMTLPFFSGVIRVVAESDLVSLIPRQLARRMAPRLGLDSYAVPIPMNAPVLFMAWHRRSSGNPAHRWMRDQIADLLLPLNADEQPLP